MDKITKFHIRNAGLVAAISSAIVFLNAILQSLGADGAQETFGSLRDFIPLFVTGGSALIAAHQHQVIQTEAASDQLKRARAAIESVDISHLQADVDTLKQHVGLPE